MVVSGGDIVSCIAESGEVAKAWVEASRNGEPVGTDEFGALSCSPPRDIGSRDALAAAAERGAEVAASLETELAEARNTIAHLALSRVEDARTRVSRESLGVSKRVTGRRAPPRNRQCE